MKFESTTLRDLTTELLETQGRKFTYSMFNGEQGWIDWHLRTQTEGGEVWKREGEGGFELEWEEVKDGEGE